MIIKENIKEVWIQRIEEALRHDDVNAGLSLTHEAAEQILEIIKQSKRRTGEWRLTYDDDDDYLHPVVFCYECGWETYETMEEAKKKYKFCPNCGADMREG